MSGENTMLLLRMALVTKCQNCLQFTIKIFIAAIIMASLYFAIFGKQEIE